MMCCTVLPLPHTRQSFATHHLQSTSLHPSLLRRNQLRAGAQALVER